MARLTKGVLTGFIPLYWCLLRLDQARRSLNQRALPVPVVSVGNLSLGGTGKTELVSRLIDELGDQVDIGVLKRGQGRLGEVGHVPVDRLSQSPEEYGDEAALLAWRHPEAVFGIGPDRYRAGQDVLQHASVDVFILDDGFQHRQLHRELDIVLLDSIAPETQSLLPAGPLREPMRALERADVIGLPRSLDTDRSYGDDDVNTIRFDYEFDCITRNQKDVTDQVKGEHLRPVLTLGRPENVLNMLVEEGFELAEPLLYPDHGTIPDQDLENLNPGTLLVTDKEWVKLPADLRHQVNRLSSRFEVDGMEELLGFVRGVLES